MSNEKLKPVRCGCGGEGKAFRDRSTVRAWWQIICLDCHTQTTWHNTEAEAVEAWNRAMSAELRSNYEVLRSNEIAEAQENPPLTWEEICGMEGKPVWIEVDGYVGHWSLVHMITPSLFGRYYAWLKSPDDPMKAPVAELNKENYGKTWQAYRKERE